MATIEELIRKEENGTLSFGNYTLSSKSKVSDFEYQGGLYKVKTFSEITKLEKNDLFVYESVPGTAVNNAVITEDEVVFTVEGNEDAQIIVGLIPDASYEVVIEGEEPDVIQTNLGGKLVFNINLEPAQGRMVTIKKIEA